MTEIIDLTGSDPADQEAVAMDVDADKPHTAQRAPAPPRAAPAEDVGAAAPPAQAPQPKDDAAAPVKEEGGHKEEGPGLGEGQRKPPRYSQREKQPARPKTAAVEAAAARPQHLPNARLSGRPSLQAMQAHLDQIQIGLRPRDPTVATLPAELPPPTRPLPPGARVIDLSEWTQERLNAEAAATASGELWAALLEDPPGLPPGRRGQYTGHERQERRRAAAAAASAGAAQNGAANGGLADGAANGAGGSGGGG